MPIDKSLMPAAVFGGLIAVGLVGAGVFVGQGVINARVGDRAVTVRGLAERDVTADLAMLPLRFTASGDVLSEVQGRIDADLATVRAFLTAQGYPAEDAAKIGTYIHGLAGDFAQKKQGMIGLIASDIITCLPTAWRLVSE